MLNQAYTGLGHITFFIQEIMDAVEFKDGKKYLGLTI